MNLDQLRAIGKPTSFSPDLACDVIEQMIEADEPERALNMLDNVPAYYRQFPTERMLEIRRSLHKALWTPVQYAGIYDELEYKPGGHWPLRAQLLEAEIKKYQGGLPPLVMELAPGGLFLNNELLQRGYDVKYFSIGLDGESFDMNGLYGTKIFVAFELIEHLTNPWEIYQNYLKIEEEADIIMLSTPLFTYGGGMPDWRNRPLGHLRTYVPNEFMEIAAKMFQGYQWEMVTGDGTMVLVGRR